MSVGRLPVVGEWVRLADRGEHYVVERRRPRGVEPAVLILACGMRHPAGQWLAVMLGPTRQACQACRREAEVQS